MDQIGLLLIVFVVVSLLGMGYGILQQRQAIRMQTRAFESGQQARASQQETRDRLKREAEAREQESQEADKRLERREADYRRSLEIQQEGNELARVAQQETREGAQRVTEWREQDLQRTQAALEQREREVQRSFALEEQKVRLAQENNAMLRELLAKLSPK